MAAIFANQIAGLYYVYALIGKKANSNNLGYQRLQNF